jgi:putative pyruvate formate lyase activating enzyme
MNRVKSFKPAYLRSFQEGVLHEKIAAVNEQITQCKLCPHECSTDRTQSHSGQCNSGDLPIISSYSPHFGEEPPLTGFNGSGTIFFGNCNLSCIFCQNYDISQCGFGEEVSHVRLAEIMLELQNQGCHNINFVSPSHMINGILSALPEAIEMGLQIPLVYNSGGYDLVSTIELLDGVIDIYMPDMKYMDNEIARQLSGIDHYVENATASILEMHRQVGDLQVNEMGIAQRGLIIRHLVLPDNIAKTNKVIDFIKSLSPNTYFNLMDQYRPAYHADQNPKINRRLSAKEFQDAYHYANSSGLIRIAD